MATDARQEPRAVSLPQFLEAFLRQLIVAEIDRAGALRHERAIWTRELRSGRRNDEFSGSC